MRVHWFKYSFSLSDFYSVRAVSNILLETQIHHNHTLAARNTNKVELSVVCLGLTAVAVPEEILAGASVEYL